MDQGIYTDAHVGAMIFERVGTARKEIILVSPYFKPWGHLERALIDARGRGVAIHLYYRAGEVDAEILARVKGAFTAMVAVPLLHAKIYCFDERVFLTSMNLLDFSNANSREIAIEVVDPGQKSEIRRWMDTSFHHSEAAFRPSTAHKPLAPKAGPSFIDKAAAFVSQATKRGPSGFCIRGHEAIPFEPSRPLCYDHYDEWCEYENPDYVEKFCHACGERARTTIAKPLCLRCYRQLAG